MKNINIGLLKKSVVKSPSAHLSDYFWLKKIGKTYYKRNVYLKIYVEIR